MSSPFIGNIIWGAGALIVLAASIIMLIKKIWLPYSTFLAFFSGYNILVSFLPLFKMPNWINNIWFGVAFLIFPILDGITTKIALTKYGAKEANPIMAMVIKKLGINVSTSLPFLIFLVLVLLFWRQFDSSTLFAIIIGYFAVIVNNVIIIERKKRRLERVKNGQ
jgi:hypothetical protein